MGFGGGGSGSFVLPDHTHSSVLDDGGELERLITKVDLDTLQTYRNFELLDAGILGSAAISYTFTPSTEIDFTDYSKVVMIIQGAKAEAGTTTAQFILNGITGNYHYEKLSVNAGAGTFSGATAQNNLPVSSSIQGSTAFNATVTVTLSDLDEGYPQIDSTYSNHSSQNDQFHWGHNTGVSAVNIVTMKFQLGAGTLLAGTRLYTYGWSR